MKILILLITLSSGSAAQITFVSATDSGDQIFFTIWLRPIGSDHSQFEKSYRIFQGEVTLVAEADRVKDEFSFVGRVSSNAIGNVIGVNFGGGCESNICLDFSAELSRIIVVGESRDFDGHVQVPPSGRYALVTQATESFRFILDPENPNQVRRVDTSKLNLEPEPLGLPPARFGRWIANDGTALVISASSPAGWELRPIVGEPISIGHPGPAMRSAILLPDASAVVYESRGLPDISEELFSHTELGIHYRDGTGRAFGVDGNLEEVSNDGTTVLFTRDVNEQRQAFVLDVATGESRQITDEPGGIAAAELTGDGSSVIVASRGRLVRIDLDLHQISLIQGSLPTFERGLLGGYSFRFPLPWLGPAPGSTYSLGGRQIASKVSVSSRPSVDALDGVSLMIGGEPAAMLWTTPTEIGFQVAWETPISDSAFLVIRHDRSGWEAPIDISGVFERNAATALPFDGNIETAIHQDFDRPVTRDDPALPNEYVHLYVTGLGRTTPAVATGQVGPQDPLARVALTCTWRAQDSAVERLAEIPFAGLAPGLIGFYQVDWKIPADPTSERLELLCGDLGSLGVFAVQMAAPQP